jgi:hypothetical protein
MFVEDMDIDGADVEHAVSCCCFLQHSDLAVVHVLLLAAHNL